MKSPSLKLPQIPNLATKIAAHILLHQKYPNSLPKLPKSVNTSLPAMMR
jgi:hypothetical protein